MTEHQPSKVWQWQNPEDDEHSSSNRPTSGKRHEQSLPRGQHPLQLYSLATPNGVKVTILLEEFQELGIEGAEYDAHLIEIGKGQQFGSGFVELNPNSKIPALLDCSVEPNVRVFESGSILLYLAKKWGHFLGSGAQEETEVLNWLFWQVGSAPYVGGGFGHFFHYAPTKIPYAIDRFTMETKRQLDVLNQVLAKRQFLAGEEYSIADIAVWPWYGVLLKGQLYNAAEFIDAKHYEHVLRWTDQLSQRPAVKRGRLVNRIWGDDNQQIPQRHSKQDFDGKDLSI